MLAQSPDLTVTVLDPDAGSVVALGDSFAVRVAVANDGAAPAGASHLRFHASLDATITFDDRVFGAGAAIPALAAGARSVHVTTDSLPSAGPWWVGACVAVVRGDPQQGNNCSAGTPIAVTVADPFFREGFESGTLDPWAAVFAALCPDDVFEGRGRNGSDDGCSGARIPIGRRQAHAHCDADWLRFDGVAGRTYRIETFALAGGADTTIAVHRDCGEVPIAADDDGGPDNRSSRVDFTAPANDVYDLHVEEWNDAYGPGLSYRIRVTCIAGCA